MVRVQTKPKTPTVDTSLELVEEFGAKVRKAREQLGLSHEELGKRLNEKVSLLKKIETAKIPKKPSRELTFGDLIQLKKKD
jgi:putative transcription factor